MKKSEVIMKLKQQGVVAVIRGNSLEEGIGISKACIAGGLTAIEMAYTNANASEIIKQLSEMYKDHKEVCRNSFRCSYSKKRYYSWCEIHCFTIFQ